MGFPQYIDPDSDFYKLLDENDDAWIAEQQAKTQASEQKKPAPKPKPKQQKLDENSRGVHIPAPMGNGKRKPAPPQKPKKPRS